MQSKEEERQETLCWLHLVQAGKKERVNRGKRDRTDSYSLKACNYKPFCLMDDNIFYNEWMEILKGESEWNWLAYCTQNNSHYRSIIAKKKSCRFYIENMQYVFLSHTLINLDLRVFKCISIPFHRNAVSYWKVQ